MSTEPQNDTPALQPFTASPAGPQKRDDFYHGEFMRAIWGDLEDAILKGNTKAALTAFNRLKDLVLSHSYETEALWQNKLDLDGYRQRMASYEVIVRQYQAQEKELRALFSRLEKENAQLVQDLLELRTKNV